jgi:hypothetical protein
MSPWTRVGLASSAAGYDAVVQLACPVLTKVLNQQNLSIPHVSKDHSSKVPPSWLSQETILQEGFRSILRLDASEDSELRMLNTAAAYRSDMETSDAYRDLFLQFEVFNSSDRRMVGIVRPTVGSMERPPSAPVTIEPHSAGWLSVELNNIPTGSHPAEFEFVDLLGGRTLNTLPGRLDTEERFTLEPELSRKPEGPSGPENLEEFFLDDDILRQFASKERFGPPEMGIQCPPEGTVTFSYRTIVDAKTDPLSVDCKLSTSTTVVLSAQLHLKIKVQHIKSVSGGSTGGYVVNALGGLDEACIVYRFVLDSEELDVTRQLKIEAPLSVSIDGVTKVVRLFVNLNQATVTFDTSDIVAQAAFEQEVKPQIVQYLSAKGSLNLAPRLSLLGPIQAGQSVQEITLQRVDVRPISAGTNAQPCFSLGFVLTGGAATPANMQNFLGTGNYAVVIAGQVMRAIAAFRWRTGDYPKERLGKPIEDSYKDEQGKTIPMLIYPRVVQKDVVDNQGQVMSGIRLLGQYLNTTFTEDHLQLGGHGNMEIVNVVRKDDSQPVPEGVKNKIKVQQEASGVLFEWPFVLSSVAPPQPHPDSNAQQWLQAMRTGVTSHLSRPFADIQTITLLAREANGNENLLRSRGVIAL